MTHTAGKALTIVSLSTLLVLATGNAQAGLIFSLDAKNPDNGYELLNRQSWEVFTISFIDGGDFSAWNAWGKTDCTSDTGCGPDSETKKGWLTNLKVEFGVGSGDIVSYKALSYPNAMDALNNAASFQVTGSESYRFFIGDNNYSDNVGGLTLKADVPVPATLALVGLGLAGLGWKRRNKA